MCQRLQQRAYPVKICSPCQEKHWASQLLVRQASVTKRLSKKCVTCIVNHFPCDVAQNQVGVSLVFLQCNMSNNSQDISLLVPIFSPRSLSPYTPIGPASLLFSLPNAPILADAVSLSIGRAPASLAGSLAAVTLSKVGVPVLLSCWF